MSLMFVALGINKQLDLQSALTEIGRIIAFDQGWYGQRQIVQVWFIIGVAAVCILIAVLLLTLARRAPAPTWLALLGTTTVLAFVLIRAASFHHIDRFIGDRILGLKWNWVLDRHHRQQMAPALSFRVAYAVEVAHATSLWMRVRVIGASYRLAAIANTHPV